MGVGYQSHRHFFFLVLEAPLLCQRLSVFHFFRYRVYCVAYILDGPRPVFLVIVTARGPGILFLDLFSARTELLFLENDYLRTTSPFVLILVVPHVHSVFLCFFPHVCFLLR